MEAKRATKKKTNLIIGMILWLICAILLIVTIIAVCESFAEKTRLEAIEATVTVKITWLFIVDVIVIVASGMFGGVFVYKKSSARVLTKKLDKEKADEEETEITGTIDEIGYNAEKIECFNLEDIVVKSDTSTLNATSETSAKSAKLKIKIGNNDSTASIPTSNHSNIEKKAVSETKSSEHSNGFFSAGGDL